MAVTGYKEVLKKFEAVLLLTLFFSVLAHLKMFFYILQTKDLNKTPCANK